MTRAKIKQLLLTSHKRQLRFWLPFLSCSLISLPTLAAEEVESLSTPLQLNLKETTVSGLSSGGFMANQMHVAYSDWIQGAAIIAAGPLYCARNSLTTALSDCIGSPKKAIDLADLGTTIKRWEKEKKIQPLANLKNDRVWILGGTKDQKVSQKIVKSLYNQYQQWLPEAQIHYEYDKPFAHHFPTLNEGVSCDTSESPFIGNCGFDTAGSLLSHLYGNLKAPTVAQKSRIKRIETKTLPDELGDSIGAYAYAYVPSQCESGAMCRLHIAFHGCNQNDTAVSLQFVEKTGYNRWAENNDLVVLYPQTKNSNMMPFNPQGCWDWWGYTDENYATQDGKQLKAINALVQKMTGK
ncbi:extracellular catalytic domain type 2 short-chain-length polyhydroxyalkanoate depolymerase [Alteromonas sp. a30]|uniref:extracellular catalytic domain type 2 short-chain-length polyhydroxyalkanoate depolymerase n=1 Tax=Alteromonas sp. a30 TaxID=2730917 RepID=UPI0022818BD5|nr:PHB depolymerase family esterase [Alteromonas sp. a30]MCY7296851.1 polyhydroxybutyrate depolymerase [Alteromonas sp. a30]